MKINQNIISRKTKKDIDVALDQAAKARKDGNKGKERVAARRAVGMAIQSYYLSRGVEFSSPANFDAVRFMSDDDDITPELQKLLKHFIQPLKKDSVDDESYWPLDVDLINEVHKVIELLNDQEQD